MKRRHRRRHHPERQPRPSLEAIVRACGCDGEQLPAYLAFAREFSRNMRKPAGLFLPVRQRRIIQKWFERGLSGYVLKRILDRLFASQQSQKTDGRRKR
jgi:hypothetical protein